MNRNWAAWGFFRCRGWVVGAALLCACGLASGCVSRPAAADTKTTANLYFNLGNAYSELEKYGEAADAYSRAYQLDPTFVSAGYNLLRTHLVQKKYDDAVRLFSALEAKEPRNTLLLETGGYLFQLKGDSETALRYYNRVLAADEVNANALFNSFLIYREANDFPAAVSLLTRYLALRPDDTKSIAQLARLLQESGDTQKAVEHYRLYLQKEPETEENRADLQQVRFTLSRLYLQQKNFSEAVRLMDELLKEDPSNASYLFDRAWASLIGLEVYDEGMDYLNRAFEAGFSDKKRATEMASESTALFHDELLALMKAKGLYDPELLSAEATAAAADSAPQAAETADAADH